MAPLIEREPLFAELFAKTNYSFLEGASHPEEMVHTAHSLGYKALGIVDSHGVYGIPRSHVAAKELKLPLIIGAELSLGASTSVFCLALNRAGYGDLCEILTTAHEDRENPHVSWEILFSKRQDIFLCLTEQNWEAELLNSLKTLFQDRLFLIASQYQDGNGDSFLKKTENLSREFKIPCLASNQPLFHIPERKPLQDTLRCIRFCCTLEEGGTRLLPNAHRHLKTPAQMGELFRGHREWLENTVRLAERCRFSLDEIHYRYPTEWIPEGETSQTYLEKLSWEGAQKRYPEGIPPGVTRQILSELKLVHELEYEDYFLTIWDIVQFARREGILCQGRGSAANSVICYVLGITSIDPVRMDLLFERFISRERKEPPDIDIDFEHERREEVIQYIYSRYGRNRAAITAEVICFRRKSSLREVAKVFSIPEKTVTQLQTLSHRRSLKDVPDSEIGSATTGTDPNKLSLYFSLVKSLLGFPRHLGTHVGGFVLCQDLLTRNVPVEKAAIEGRTIVQWDKNDLDALGFVRVDILGLGILTCIRKSFQYIRETYGKDFTLANLPAEDPAVYKSLSEADTIGVFQIESRAQMNMLPRLKPERFYDLVVEISLVRPGPIQGDMVHPYLRRRSGKESVSYPHPDLESILKKTYGVPLFQEQIMKIAMVVAGFSGGEADELRRAMGTWRREGGNRLSRMGDKFRKGLIARGISQEFADRIFHQIEGFAEYGFPESHAASFAILAYATAFLKHYYPDAFLVALLNAQPMGFYSSHTLLNDGLRHGVKVHGVDIQISKWDNFLLKRSTLALGFREIKGMKEIVGAAIEKARAGKTFLSFSDFVERTQASLNPVRLTKRDLFLLATANAFEPLGLSRRSALWEIQGLSLQESEAFAPMEEKTQLPLESPWEKITGDFKAQGICLSQHPMAYLRPELNREGIISSLGVKHAPLRKRARAAGLVICRQMPATASGVLFITLEDEFGFINCVIWNRVFQNYRIPLLTESLLLCEGRLEKAEDGNVIHLIVEAASPLRPTQAALTLSSHDFH